MGNTPLTGDSSIAAWLDDPTGNAILTEMLAQGGQTPDVFKPIKRLAIKRLVKMSRGAFTQEMLDDLVRRAAAGDVPAAATEAAPAPAAAAPDAAASAPELREWIERIDQGRFTGQTVIVTGAGSGIGRATASRDRPRRRPRDRGRCQPGAPRRVRRRSRRRRRSSRSPPTSPMTPGVARIIEAAGEQIDGLANIAGIMDDMTPVGDVSDAVWDRVFRVNVTGTMKLMRAVIPAMLAQGGGSIVNTASEAALRGSAAGVAYTASKHAVVGPHQEQRVHVRTERHPRQRRRARADDHQHRGELRLAAGRRPHSDRDGDHARPPSRPMPLRHPSRSC